MQHVSEKRMQHDTSIECLTYYATHITYSRTYPKFSNKHEVRQKFCQSLINFKTVPVNSHSKTHIEN